MVRITTFLPAGSCTWCRKETEVVRAAFDNNKFLQDTPLCFKCFQRAIRVYHAQSQDVAPSLRLCDGQPA